MRMDFNCKCMMCLERCVTQRRGHALRLSSCTCARDRKDRYARNLDGDASVVLLHAMQRLHIILSADSPRAVGFGSRRVHCGRKRLRAQLHGPGIASVRFSRPRLTLYMLC